MTATASSPAFHNLPFRWRRKAYMTTGHTISQLGSFDGPGASAAPQVNDPTTGPSTGPSTGPQTHHTPPDKGEVAYIKIVKAPQDETTVVACCQEPEPEASSSSASPAVNTVYTINYEKVWGQLQYMQWVMEERKRAANAEQAEKENMGPPSRPLKRKRAAPRPTPAGPVRQSKRLRQKGQGRGKA